MSRWQVALLLTMLTAGCVNRQPAGSMRAADQAGWPSRFTALGTEPFWNARVEGTTLTYSTPEDQAGTRATVSSSAAPDRITFVGILRGRPFTLALSRGPCSDGMSDRIYSYAATRALGDDVQRGCAAPL